MGSCLWTGDYHVRWNIRPRRQGGSDRQVAAEYTGLSEAAAPFLGSYYLRIAEDYQDQSQRELRALEREKITALATGADMPSPPPQPNHAS
jgi:hypothetical protein